MSRCFAINIFLIILGMRISVLLFGIARDIVEDKMLYLELDKGSKVGDLKQAIVSKFPRFEDLKYLNVAVNNEYAQNDATINEHDEIALIPPVSGG